MLQPVRVHGPYPEGKRFRLVVVEGGARKSLKCKSAEEAERLKAELLSQLRAQVSCSIGDAIAEFYAHMLHERGCKEGSADTYKKWLTAFLPCHLPLSALTPQRAAQIYRAETERRIRDRPIAAATHRNRLKVARLFCRWAQACGYLRDNPFAKVAPVGRVNAGKPQLTLDEARRLVQALRQAAEQDDRRALMLLTLLLLGLRAGEVTARTVADLDDGGRVLWIPFGKTANARRRLAIPELLQPFLRRLASAQPPGSLLFGAAAHTRTLHGALGRFCAQAGVSRVCPHSLRGLHATLAISAGSTSHSVAAALGHSSFAITAKHYVDPSSLINARVRTAADVLCSPSATNPDPDPDPPPAQAAPVSGSVRALLESLSAEQLAELRAALGKG